MFVALWLVSSPPNARAFVVNRDVVERPRHWTLANFDSRVSTNVVNPATHAIRYFFASDAYSTTNQAAELNALRAAFSQWQAIPGTILKFEDAGLIAPVNDVNNQDDRNTIYFKKGGTSYLVNGELDDIRGLLAYTYVSTFDDNTIAEADTVINGVDFTWFTDFSTVQSAGFFIEANMLHEVGHFIGLEHSPVGGATMFVRGLPGINTQAGLSRDEISAALSLYPQAATPATLGTLQGRVTINGAGVFGAVVTLEDMQGNIAAGTVTRPSGNYELPALPPENYFARVTPLDPESGSSLAFAVRGSDISPDFSTVQTNFLPATNQPVTLRAGAFTALNFAVTGGSPRFRITWMRPPTDLADLRAAVHAPTTINLGQSNFFVGVYSLDLPASGARFAITGDGLTLGAPQFLPQAISGMNLISIPIDVARNATPGLRSFVVQQGTNVAYANGFLEILPAFPDFNFDGLDDRFQRKSFPLFTAPQAGPKADPDGDGFTNEREFLAGSDPTDAASFLFRIVKANLTAQGAFLNFETAPGKKYQILRRDDFNSATWQPAGSPISATNGISQFLDAAVSNSMRFYRVLALP
ncbi:MAG: matrixin family metalloprotease [Verrucomicrobia bacterium]|nr:matrixin family metalloprotease [Verrucomicrobiota bacterium]